ncbi:MAG: hypothetical protein EOR99_06415 [Mesorhizobium sp.]|nr:MAG: hypothetical protein EOR99_06415 [Mesorhizobium sp.]RWQ65272.1 MAG: hypothetical protein EOS86_15865 [Mesorhizobium sp.]
MSPKTGIGFRWGSCADSKSWSVLCASNDARRSKACQLDARPYVGRPIVRCMSPKSVKRFWDNDMHKSALSQPTRLRKD